MIPIFPEFKKLEITDKKNVEKITKLFLPFSDYNFVSLWSWNTQNQTEISQLSDNLVIKFQDYITNDIFYSLLGKTDVDSSITEIINYIKKLKRDSTLRLIPEPVIHNIKEPQNFIIKEDHDNSDYILSVDELIHLQGKKYRGKKNFINRLHKIYEEKKHAKIIDSTDKHMKKEIVNLFLDWEKTRGKSRNETSNELIAIQRLLDYSHLLDLQVVGVFIEDKLRGFSINEVSWNHYGIIHYEKADISHVGIFQYLKQQSAINFKKHGCEYINYEQDLGIEGLRQAKLAWHPVKLLKKYTIALRENQHQS